MNVLISTATVDDAPEIALLRNTVAEDLCREFGPGFWSHTESERGVLRGINASRVLIARVEREIIATLRLTTKKPWAIDPDYFAPAKCPLYLVDMAVSPGHQRKGVGRQSMHAAQAVAWDWPADAIRLDAFDAPAGAGGFYERCGYREKGRVTYRKTPLIYFELLP